MKKFIRPARLRRASIAVEVVMAAGMLTLIFGLILAVTRLIVGLYFDASYSAAQRPWL